MFYSRSFFEESRECSTVRFNICFRLCARFTSAESVDEVIYYSGVEEITAEVSVEPDSMGSNFDYSFIRFTLFHSAGGE